VSDWSESICQIKNPIPPDKNTELSIEDIFLKFPSLFSAHGYDIGFCSNYRFSIKTKSDVPICLPSRRVPIHLEDKVDSMIEDMLKAGIICESTSPYNSPLVIVPKKDGNIRLCVDYRSLNKITEREQFHIPDSIEIFDQLGGNGYFSTLDLSKGYYQIGLDEDSQKKTAFSTSKGHYQFLRLPFGLCGAPTSFQKCMQQILCKELGLKCCVYIDDIIVFGKNKKEHDRNLIDVLARLNQAGIKLSKDKFKFSLQRISFLGHCISIKGIETDPLKVECIKTWKRPETFKELNTFIGFVSYYRRFVKNFATTVNPLVQVANKKKENRNKKLMWNDSLQEAFEKIKELLCKNTILNFPNKTGIFVLDTDASLTGIGAVLSQVDDNGTERVIAFASNKLSTTEARYCTTRRELLAVVRYIHFFHHYLIGKRFILRTDHQSLKWLFSWKMPSTSQYFSWLSQLQLYDFEIQYRPGSQHVNADALSRLPWCKQCKSSHVIDTVTVSRENDIQDLISLISNNQPPSAKHSSFVTNLWHKRKYLSVENNQIYIETKNGKRIVKTKAELTEMCKKIHQCLCHMGSESIFQILSRKYYCPGLKSICKNVTTFCIICLQRKSVSYKGKPLDSLSASSVFDKVYMDVAGPLPEQNGFKYILVLIDGFSSFISLSHLKNVNASTIAEQIFNKWISVFGPPRALHADNALYFKASPVQDLCKEFGIRQSFSSPFYPQGNGKAERAIRTVKDMLFCAMKEKGRLWPNLLTEVEYAFRSAIRNNIGLSPMELVFGRYQEYQPNSGKISNKFSIQNIQNLIEKFDDTKNSMIKPKNLMNSMVMVKILPETHSILQARYTGPCRVVEVKAGGKCLVLETLEGKKIVRNIRHIKLIGKDVMNLLPYSDEKKLKTKYQAATNIPLPSLSRSNNSHSDPHSQSVEPHVYPQRRREPVKRFGYHS